MTRSLCYGHEALTSLAPYERLPELPVIPRVLRPRGLQALVSTKSVNLNNGKLCPEIKSDFFDCLMIVFFTVLGEPSLAFEQNDNTLVSFS